MTAQRFDKDAVCFRLRPGAARGRSPIVFADKR